jgi:two-component system LytT family response regulator
MKKQGIDVLIVDSDPDSRDRLNESLRAVGLVSSVDQAGDTDEALFKLISVNPDLVLMEYPAPGRAGQELIRFIRTKNENCILAFVSTTRQYAAVAIRNGIFNYLVKPVSSDELDQLVGKVYQIKQTNISARVQEIIEKSQEKVKLRFQVMKGYLLVDPVDILYCKAEGFYSEVYLRDGRKELSYLFMSKLEEILKEYHFVRVSRSYIVNTLYIRKLFAGQNTVVLSANGKEVEIRGSKAKIKMLTQFASE